MFMITAIGTAVIIQKKKKESLHGTPRNASANFPDRIDNEKIQRLQQLKVLQEKAKKGELEFSQEVWEFITQNRIKEFFPQVLIKLEKLLNNPTHYMEETVSSFKDNTDNYLRALDIEDQISVVYHELQSSETSKRVEEYLCNIIKEDLLLDFERVKNLLQDDHLKVRKRGMILSTCSRPYYTEQDLKNYEELIELIATGFPKTGTLTTKKQLLSSKEKEVWQCKCGKNNEIEINYCTKCGNDIRGFGDREPKPEKAISIIQNKISLLKETMENEEAEKESIA